MKRQRRPDIRNFLTFILPFVFPIATFAQPFQRGIDGIPVNVRGVDVSQPFAGGIDSPLYQFADLDSDGDQDLVVMDTDRKVDFYRNEGTSTRHDFRLRASAITFPPIQFWFLFEDLSGDGLPDLLTDDGSTRVSYYKNVGDGRNPTFELVTHMLIDSTDMRPLESGYASVPALADLDGDGDADFLSSNTLTGTFNYYENLGARESPSFRFITDTFQGIAIVNDSCSSGLRTIYSNRHGASAFTFADIDANGTKDLFYGDLNSLGIFFMRNEGTPTVPQIVCATSRYPEEAPVITGGFNMPSLTDIDGDGDRDLFVGLLGGIVQRNGFWMLENAGDSTEALFIPVTREFLSMVDVGQYSHPAFTDIDDDGDSDLFVGNLNGEIWFFRNDGSADEPAFTLFDTAYAAISGDYTFAPAFADLDHDGDADLIVGRFDGRLKMYRNDGNPSVAAFNPAASGLDGVDVGQNAVPVFGDLDKDGDLDLLIGKGNGTVSFFRNEGSVSSFDPVLIDDFFEGIDAGRNSKPALNDFDRDGDLDLFVTNDTGSIVFYHNESLPDEYRFVEDSTIRLGTDKALEPVPAFIDIDADGDDDLFLGTSKGGLHWYGNGRIVSVGEPPSTTQTSLLSIRNHPNPFNGETNISISVPSGGPITVTMYDASGKEIDVLVRGYAAAGLLTIRWNAGSLPTGVYILNVQHHHAIVTHKLIHLK